MQKEILNIKQAFSLIEVLFASALFALLTGALFAVLFYGTESISLAGKRAQAVFFANEGLEAVRNIRDDDFANLIDGTYGLVINNNQWEFSGSEDIRSGFTRQITISTIDSNLKQIRSDVSWRQNLQRDDTITLYSYLSNWRAINITGPQADNLIVDTSNAYVGQGANAVFGITFQNAGSFSVTIDKVIVSWSPTTRRMEEIVFDDIIVWSLNGPGSPTGKQVSGVEIDIENYTLAPFGEIVSDNTFKFEGNIRNNIFDFSFVMSDGSVKTVQAVDPLET